MTLRRNPSIFDALSDTQILSMNPGMFFFFSFLFILISCHGDESPRPGTNSPSQEDLSAAVYDSTKAKLYGADPYGMKRYVMAFLKSGSNPGLDSTQAANLQKAHLENIIQMAADGKLVMAGPFLDDGDIRGIYIFNVPTIAEAEVLTNSDPAIRAGTLVMELKPWYGSAALMEINDIHQTLSERSIIDPD